MIVLLKGMSTVFLSEHHKYLYYWLNVSYAYHEFVMESMMIRVVESKTMVHTVLSVHSVWNDIKTTTIDYTHDLLTDNSFQT